jgi:DNA-binding LacI/PurR family transcriptional regulator
MTKLADIARVLNLDVSVISRALSQSPKNQRRVNPETRKPILETAEKMNYVPDRSAAFLRQKKAPTILCYLPGYTDRLLGNLVMGISEEASRQKFPVSFFFGKKNVDFEMFLDALTKIKHSAVITYPPNQMTANCGKKLEDYHQRGGHILILNACSNGGIRDERFVGMPQFQINDVYGGKLVAEHFLNKGVGCFFYTRPYPSYESRYLGYKRTLAERGFSSKIYSVTSFIKAVKSGHKVGIFALTDSEAVNIMLSLASQGYRAGVDYLLSGHDDQFLSSRLIPSLTTVHQPTLEEGILAVKKVICLMEGGTVENELLNPWLMIRESTGGSCPDLEHPESETVMQ